MSERYNWALSPSKFEASSGCPCFEENPFVSETDKSRGTDLHKFMEDKNEETLAALEQFEPEERNAVLFCLDFEKAICENYSFVKVYRELKIPKTNRHPSGLIDFCGISEDHSLVILDWKFGVKRLTPAEGNMQLKAYALMAHEYFRHTYTIDVITVGIVQPAQELIDLHDFVPSDLDKIENELKAANDRVIDPFKQPDPSDAEKCQRCKHIDKCPAVSGAVTEFIEQTKLLPMPENFLPEAVVSERDRVIAQELAVIFEAWAAKIKKSNREYALQNDNTLAGVYNISTRSNGHTVENVRAYAEALVDEGLLEKPEDLLDFANITKTALVKGLGELNSDENVKDKINKLHEEYGVAKPEVIVFRKGGKRKIEDSLADLNIPMIENPFK